MLFQCLLSVFAHKMSLKNIKNQKLNKYLKIKYTDNQYNVMSEVIGDVQKMEQRGNQAI